MYRSRCRPREEEVKAWLQNGQFRSLAAFVPLWLAPFAPVLVEDEGVDAPAGV